MRKSRGLTLLEVLIAMAILGILLLAFTQLFTGSLRASSEVNARNELLYEGQIAQQLIAARLQQAAYIYPNGTTLQLTNSGTTTKNTVRSGAGQNWIMGTDPFIAMLLPPEQSGGVCQTGNLEFCFSFFAYYPMRRGTFVSSSISSANKPDPNPTNEDMWLLMEYRANVVDGVDRSSSSLLSPPTSLTSFNAFIKSKSSGRILVDYVQPSNDAPAYTMFNVNEAEKWIDFELRLLQNRSGKALVVPGTGSSLDVRVYPRNW